MLKQLNALLSGTRETAVKLATQAYLHLLDASFKATYIFQERRVR